VLETQFTHLLDKVSTTHDFETIQHAHENFVTSLQSQLFLLLPAVSLGMLYTSLLHLLHHAFILVAFISLVEATRLV